MHNWYFNKLTSLMVENILPEYEVTGFNGNLGFMPSLTGHDILAYVNVRYSILNIAYS